MKVTLIQNTPNPEKIIAAAAKLCYSDSSCENIMNGLTDEKTNNFIKMLADLGHESPVEHVTFTFGIEGVSRTLLAQITRHRLASFSVQSQRYVKKDNFIFITPPSISSNPEIEKMYIKSMNDSFTAYNIIADNLSKKYYNEFLEAGINEKQAKSKAEKKAIEDARFVLPNACETKMVVTMNVRSLMNFFKLRCCKRAQWEIRALAMEMYKLCFKTATLLFINSGPSCVCGNCSEGKMSCGMSAQVKEEFDKIKEKAKNR